MSRIVLFLILCGTVATPAVVGQDHVAVGAYADYFRLSQTDTNFAGVGGRLGVGLGHRVMLEAEMSYDFNQVFTENFDNGGTIIVNRSNLRLLHGLFGPKLALGHTNVHPFSSPSKADFWTLCSIRRQPLLDFFPLCRESS